MIKKNSFKSNINAKLLIPILMVFSFSLMSFVVYKNYNMLVSDMAFKTPENVKNETKKAAVPLTVSSVVSAALTFKGLLTTTQQATLQQTYTASLARKWSNLPCGSGCRNGMQFSNLTSAQLTAAKAVIQAALSTSTSQGYDIFNQILLADDYLNANGGGSGYGSGIYFISFLNTPSTTGSWMLQFGGHHYAYNISFVGGQVVGTTPHMLGVEPTSFTTNTVTYTPMTPKHDAMTAMLASLSTTQLASAKLTTTFSDCLMSPGETNGNTNTMPSTKQGLICSGFTTAQKNLVIAAMAQWTNDLDSDTAAALATIYNNDINSTYVAWTGSGTAGTASTFLNANTNYVRIDGPSVWIEFVCQNGVVFTSQIHYHSVWRDHLRDYGADLTRTALGTVEVQGNAINYVSAYPNPASESINIKVNDALKNATVTIFDATGKMVTTSTNISGKSFNLSVSKLNSGNYIISVKDGTQKFTAKFIKK